MIEADSPPSSHAERERTLSLPKWQSKGPTGELSPLRSEGASHGPGVEVVIPPEGAALIEYDWAIPLGAHNVEAALAFISNLQLPGLRPSNYQHPLSASTRKLIPLTPLPAAALAQRADLWARLKEIAA
jgi:spermidine/putrescine-binding protein